MDTIFTVSHKQNPRIRTQDCIPGYEFEIKTDKGSGHNTLPPSAHRNDPNFRYSHVGRRDKIAIIEELYDILTELLSEYLTEKNKTSYGGSKKLKTIDYLCRSKCVMLKDDQIIDSVSQLTDYYQQGYRDAPTFEFSGFDIAKTPDSPLYSSAKS